MHGLREKEILYASLGFGYVLCSAPTKDLRMNFFWRRESAMSNLI